MKNFDNSYSNNNNNNDNDNDNDDDNYDGNVNENNNNNHDNLLLVYRAFVWFFSRKDLTLGSSLCK